MNRVEVIDNTATLSRHSILLFAKQLQMVAKGVR